jgi:hypothetical protein
MTVRKEKEKEFYAQHMNTFKKIGQGDPFFLVKTAFFQKGKYGRQVQFFESELSKGEDIYVEFYDNVTDDKGSVVNIKPFYENRQLFKYRYNPFFSEEYDTKEGTNYKGDPYKLFTVPVSELLAVLPDGTEITYALFEKRGVDQEKKSNDLDRDLPKLQSSLVQDDFPDFTEGLTTRPATSEESFAMTHKDPLVSDMTIQDFAAIMWRKPVSNKEWLNNLIIKS